MLCFHFSLCSRYIFLKSHPLICWSFILHNIYIFSVFNLKADSNMCREYTFNYFSLLNMVNFDLQSGMWPVLANAPHVFEKNVDFLLLSAVLNSFFLFFSLSHFFVLGLDPQLILC